MSGPTAGPGPTPAAPAPAAEGWTSFVVHGIRYLDILVTTTYATLGAVLSAPALNGATVLRFAFFSAANFLFITHVFIYNDWCDALLNPDEPRTRDHHALKSSALSPGQVLLIGFLVLALAMIGFALIDLRIAALAAVIELLTLAYSNPRVFLKGRPGVSLATHFSGAALYLLCGYAVFAQLDARAWSLAVFIGLTLCGGHFSNEIEGFEADLAAGIRTNTVVLGQRAAFRLGLLAFILSSSFFTFSSFLLDLPCGYLAAGAGLCLTWIAAAVGYRSFKGGDSVQGFRSFYRAVYAVFTAAVCLVRFIEISRGP